jgi:hypothetical protein
MFWIFQGLIIFAVIASNIAWQWTPNPYLAGLIGVGVAYLATRVILKGLELKRPR